jgi:hypothetical protein
MDSILTNNSLPFNRWSQMICLTNFMKKEAANEKGKESKENRFRFNDGRNACAYDVMPIINIGFTGGKADRT